MTSFGLKLSTYAFILLSAPYAMAESTMANPYRATEHNRLVFGETALMRPPEMANWRTTNIGYHAFDYTFSEHFEAGVSTLVPVGFYGLGANLKLATSLSEYVHIGLVGQIGMVGTFITESDPVFGFGGGPVLTLGDESFLVNISAPFYGGLASGETEWMALPNVGVAGQVSETVSLHLEAGSLLYDGDENGKLWGVIYGIRFAGEQIYGDVSFLIPVYENVVEDFLKYIPIGLPVLSLGYRW